MKSPNTDEACEEERQFLLKTREHKGPPSTWKRPLGSVDSDRKARDRIPSNFCSTWLWFNRKGEGIEKHRPLPESARDLPPIPRLRVQYPKPLIVTVLRHPVEKILSQVYYDKVQFRPYDTLSDDWIIQVSCFCAVVQT